MAISEDVKSRLSAEEADHLKEALRLDAEDKLASLRQEFVFPTRTGIRSKTILDRQSSDPSSEEPCTYLCGNSLGVQPRLVSQRVSEHLANWAQKGVTGHWTRADDATLDTWLDADDAPARLLAPLVGASPDEVGAMETLTANLHFMLASFYKPTKERFKIIMEGKAFPSDHYSVETHLRQHDLVPREAQVTIFPEAPATYLTTEQVIAVITKHASSTALVLLPGIQYYTGQLLDIPTITAHAHSLGITIGWDLAHAAGNVPLYLHEWDVDFAVWCHYKYINAGPGAIGGYFVHEKHSRVDESALASSGSGGLQRAYRHRLGGWWGHDKSARFQMNTVREGDAATAFVPRPSARGFQLGNPCIIALAALQGALEVFAKTDMETLRAKSIRATGFLEGLLDWHVKHFWDGADGNHELPFWIITPRDPKQRGAQLNIQLRPGILDTVMQGLDEQGIIVDERKPDVVRVAPAPLYNSFEECWFFAHAFAEVCKAALRPDYKARLAAPR